ncbi:MAG: YdcF family protein [Hyphomicrobiales bacterium]
MNFLSKCFAIGLATYVLLMVSVMAGSLWLSGSVESADVALVLGSKVLPNGTLSPALNARMERAYELEQAHKSITYVVSGGIGDEGVDEAIAMADFLKVSGVAKNRIMTDSSGINTLESVRYIAENFPTETKIIIVSQFFHIPRTILALRKAGFKNVSGAAVPPRFFRDIYSTAREVPALFVYACCRSL